MHKTIGVVAVSYHSFKIFLEELGVVGDEINKFTFINKAEHVYGRNFTTVIRARFFDVNWDLHELFSIAKERIR